VGLGHWQWACITTVASSRGSEQAIHDASPRHSLYSNIDAPIAILMRRLQQLLLYRTPKTMGKIRRRTESSSATTNYWAFET
jgi:hypothetical protein